MPGFKAGLNQIQRVIRCRRVAHSYYCQAQAGTCQFSSQENWPIESNTRRALPRFHLFNIGGHILPRDADRRAKNGDWVRAEYDTKVSLISRPVLFLRARNKHDSYEIFDR